ncbi:hypothetical protein MHYP_G00312580 [Metynnis hypsauchen]
MFRDAFIERCCYLPALLSRILVAGRRSICWEAQSVTERIALRRFWVSLVTMLLSARQPTLCLRLPPFSLDPKLAASQGTVSLAAPLLRVPVTDKRFKASGCEWSLRAGGLKVKVGLAGPRAALLPDYAGNLLTCFFHIRRHFQTPLFPLLGICGFLSFPRGGFQRAAGPQLNRRGAVLFWWEEQWWARALGFSRPQSALSDQRLVSKYRSVWLQRERRSGGPALLHSSAKGCNPP